MWIDFDEITDDARVWIYQANRPLSQAEVTVIDEALRPALNNWAAHGQSLLAAARVVENRFVVIAVDEDRALPSGCSIDASVRFVQQTGQQLGLAGAPVDFMDRSAAYQSVDGSVATLSLTEIKTAIADGRLSPETTVFNTLVKTKAEFRSQWQVKAVDTWLKRYFKKRDGLMAETLVIPQTSNRQDVYEALLPQLASLTEGEPDLIANLANITAALKEAFGFFWVGFYLTKNNQLVLGPFQGPIACTRIHFDKGVCGAAYTRRETMLVPDVEQFPGHIACSSASKSEVVVPVFDKMGAVAMVLDVDSDQFDDFSRVDVEYLQQVAQLITGLL